MAYPTAESRDIAAHAETVWWLVSDLPRMGQMANTLQNLAAAAEYSAFRRSALSKGIGSTPSFLFRRQSSHDVRGRDSIAGPSTLLQA